MNSLKVYLDVIPEKITILTKMHETLKTPLTHSLAGECSSKYISGCIDESSPSSKTPMNRSIET